MPHERQKALTRELNERVPRGLRGSPQNQLRFGIWFYGSQGVPFEDSVQKALVHVRELHPGFVPTILPAP